MKPNPHKFGSQGFTLVELLITVAIATILATLATPSFREMIVSNYATTTVNTLIGNFSLARTISVTKGIQTEVRSISGKWQNGWQVFADNNRDGVFSNDEIVRVMQPIRDDFEFKASNSGTSNTDLIRFDPTGAVIWPPDRPSVLFLCRPDRNKAKSITITVASTGHVQATHPGSDC